MFYRLRSKLSSLKFNYLCRGILDTPPLVMRPAPLRLVSIISHRDLRMYLLAIKSLYSTLGEGRILILSDGTLTARDASLLRAHLPDLWLGTVDEMDTGRCQRGGTWERLVWIHDLTRDYYVIQVDSDTVTCGAIPEVVDCYRRNCSFALGTSTGQCFVSPEESYEVIRHSPSQHVQVLAERNLRHLPDAAGLRYVRACSGFAGFARGAFHRQRLEQFSLEMETLLGARWREWGSEQVASNFAIANSSDAIVLPFPKYASFDPNLDWPGCAFLHFIGPHRFAGGVYARVGRAAIARMPA
jgi:hypothetical protein